MALAPTASGEMRLVECPFCAQPLESGHGPGSRPADHLRECDAFHAAWGPETGPE